jgi:hypothetical protein
VFSDGDESTGVKSLCLPGSTSRFGRPIFVNGISGECQLLGAPNIYLVGSVANEAAFGGHHSFSSTESDVAEAKKLIHRLFSNGGKALPSDRRCDFVKFTGTLVAPLPPSHYSFCGFSKEGAQAKFGAQNVSVYNGEIAAGGSSSRQGSKLQTRLICLKHDQVINNMQIAKTYYLLQELD